MRYHLILIKMAMIKIQNSPPKHKITNAENVDHLPTVGRIVKWCNCCEKQYGVPQKIRNNVTI